MGALGAGREHGGKQVCSQVTHEWEVLLEGEIREWTRLALEGRSMGRERWEGAG